MSSRIVEYFEARSVVVYPYRWWLGILAVLLVALMFSLFVRPDGSVNLVWVAFIWSAFVWLWGGTCLAVWFHPQHGKLQAAIDARFGLPVVRRYIREIGAVFLVVWFSSSAMFLLIGLVSLLRVA